MMRRLCPRTPVDDLSGLNNKPGDDGMCASNVREARRALVDIGADRLELIGAAHQFHLLDGFGEQRRAGIDGKIVQQTLGGADRVRTLAGDLARDLEGRGARVVADPRRETVTQASCAEKIRPV